MAVQKRGVAGKAKEVAVSINGTQVTAAGGTLLDLLHHQLRLRGTRTGCGEGHCGACMVLVDGAPVSACVTPVASVANREVRTIEGLAEGRRLHPVQEAFLAQGAYHCGYCGPGIIMETVALLSQTPNPTPDLVQQKVNGHLCRCGVQTKIVAAVLDAAGRMQTVR
jgi:aerobic-type carbon monoxide dehydrogenase small subunit (CoxS/CutS family)